MCWNNVDTRCKIMYGEQFLSSPKPLDRRYIINAIADEFPQFPRVRIAVAVDRCFQIMPGPVSRRTFVTFVQSSLR